MSISTNPRRMDVLCLLLLLTVDKLSTNQSSILIQVENWIAKWFKMIVSLASWYNLKLIWQCDHQSAVPCTECSEYGWVAAIFDTKLAATQPGAGLLKSSASAHVQACFFALYVCHSNLKHTSNRDARSRGHSRRRQSSWIKVYLAITRYIRPCIYVGIYHVY